jgi:hypothetical protein
MIAYLPNRSKVYLFLLLSLLSTISAHGQRRTDDTSHYRSEPIPAHLLPIERAYGSSLGNTYFYGGKRLSSPYSLEIPFYELADPTVTHHFQAFKTLTTLSRLTALIPLGYIILTKSPSSGAYWTVYGGSLVASLTCSIIGNSQVNKAVTRYNQMLRQPRIGLSVDPVSLTRQAAVGVGIAYGF